MRLDVEEARALGIAALRTLRYTEEEARIIADHLIDNALCGYRFAGLPRILAIAESDRTGKARGEIRITYETPLSARVDGGNNVGYLAASRGADIAIEKARTSGFAAVGVYNSYYSGRNAYYAERIARAGFVAIHPSTAIPRVVPMGGARPALGPNPICIGFPSVKDPLIVDMGTAAMMWGEVMLHAHLGKALPEGVGFDAQGNPTRDASEALAGGVGTFGGYKGYALSIAVQTLGLLAGSGLSGRGGQDFAFLFLVIDPKLLHPIGDFPQQVAELMARIKATPRQAGVSEIRIPSERAFREREKRLAQGIVIDTKVVDSLKAMIGAQAKGASA
jgi:LDH2 family malate/lactate/ureidoglycolate dehydrogenase